MSYGLIYTLPFKDIKQKLYTVKVEQDGYTGKAVELKGQPSPFTVDIDTEEFLYTPLRLSTATLHTFGSDYLQSLFSTNYRMNRVTLYDGSTPVWCGYVKPEVYTQDFRHEKFPLDIECYSAMSVLEFLDFKQQGDTRGFISLWDIIKLCVRESGGLYSAVYIPHTYAKDSGKYSSWENPLPDMKVSQQNFFDEDDKAMTLKEVLEHVMKLLNWTCVDWRGELYFIDADGTGEYYKYTPDFSSYTKAYADRQAAQGIGYSGSNHTLDIIPGYNKVVINCSNYSIEEDIPAVNFDLMKFDSEQIFGSIESGKRRFVRLYKTEKESPVYTQWYKLTKSDGTLTPTTESTVGAGELLCGAQAQKEEVVEYVDGKPTNIEHNYTEQIYIPLGWQTGFSSTSPKASPIYTEEKPIMVMKGGYSAYQGGGFGINFNVLVSIFKDQTRGEALDSYDFHFSLRIGEYYYHGKSDGSFIWDKSPAYNSEYPNNLEVDWKDEAMGGSGDISLFDQTYDLKTSRTLDDGYEGLKGFIVKFPNDKVLTGDLEIIFYGPKIEGIRFSTFESLTIRNFKIGYKAGGEEKDDTDRIYENVINEAYINPLDDIEMKISSYNDDGACYSKVLINDGYLTDNLYNGITGELIRPEDFLIRRIINHYESTKYKLSLDLKRADIKPYTIMTDNNTQGKTYINIGGEIDYKENKFTCILLEHETGTNN